MRWRLILEEFGPNILHIKGEENVVADAISRLPTANEDQNKSRTEIPGLSSEMLAKMEYLVFEEDSEFPLHLPLVRKVQQQELNRKNSKLKQAINDKDSGLHIITLDNVEIVASKIVSMFLAR